MPSLMETRRQSYLINTSSFDTNGNLQSIQFSRQYYNYLAKRYLLHSLVCVIGDCQEVLLLIKLTISTIQCQTCHVQLHLLLLFFDYSSVLRELLRTLWPSTLPSCALLLPSIICPPPSKQLATLVMLIHYRTPRGFYSLSSKSNVNTTSGNKILPVITEANSNTQTQNLVTLAHSHPM